MSAARVAVVGAGISGLATAYHLQKRGHAVTVLEASPAVGGKLRTTDLAGIAIEEGPDAFLPRDDEAAALCREVGVDDLIEPEMFGAYVWHRGALRRLPEGTLYGIPRSPKDAWQAGLLSAPGAARAALEALRVRPLSGGDVAVGPFVRRRFGREVLEHMVDALLAGVRGGSTENMSLAAATKEIDAPARRSPSILRALRTQGPPAPPRFVAPRGGMSSLAAALVARLHDVRVEWPVARVTPSERGVTVEGDGSFEADAVVLAVPSHAAADLVAGFAPGTAERLRTIRFASVAVVALVYPPGAVQVPPDGSGFLVASGAGKLVAGCTFYSAKWPHVIGPDGRIVLRCVVGRSDIAPHDGLDDDDLVARVHADLQAILSVGAPPLSHRITRWERGVPQLEVGHADLVDTIDAELAAAGPVAVTGAGYGGAGIPDCIAQARRTAERVSERLRQPSALG